MASYDVASNIRQTLPLRLRAALRLHFRRRRRRRHLHLRLIGSRYITLATFGIIFSEHTCVSEVTTDVARLKQSIWHQAGAAAAAEWTQTSCLVGSRGGGGSVATLQMCRLAGSTHLQ